jgi:hypothetical protein
MSNDPYDVLPEQIDILVDEIEKARLVASPYPDHYSQGYYHGLMMALDILWGKVE